jgi:hypothetical protein
MQVISLDDVIINVHHNAIPSSGVHQSLGFPTRGFRAADIGERDPTGAPLLQLAPDNPIVHSCGFPITAISCDVGDFGDPQAPHPGGISFC